MSVNSPAPGARHYNSAAIRQSLLHFMLGKGFAAISTLLVLVIIVRELSLPEFGAYTSLHALTLIIGLLSSLGIPQVLHRFLPELRTQQNYRAMYRLLTRGIALRALSYAAFCVLLLPVLDLIGSAFKLDSWLAIMPLYLLVGFLRVNAAFTAQALESLLWQRDAQYSLATGAIVKLLMTVYLAASDSLNLANFVWAECLSEATSFCMLFLFMSYRWLRDADREMGDDEVLHQDRDRYLRFAGWCYLQNVTSVFYGSAPNRLFVAYFLSAEFIAVFGVIDRLIDFAKRYEPLHLFIGLIRPVLLSRYSQNRDFDQLVRLGNLILLANFILLFVPFVLLVVAGDELLSLLSDGKYVDVKWIAAAFYLALMITSVTNLLDVLVKAVEHNRVYMFANVLLSGSLLLAIPLIATLDLWAVMIANVVGLACSLTIVNRYLVKREFHYHYPWYKTAVLTGLFAAATGVGLLLAQTGMNAIIAAVIGSVLYLVLLLFFIPLDQGEKATLRELLPARLRNRIG